jgi:AraC-like DNA-binding protein
VRYGRELRSSGNRRQPMSERRDEMVWEDAPVNYTFIPNYVIRSGLDSDIFALLLLLLTYAGDEFPGEDRLANDMGVSKRTLKRRFTKLTELGLVRHDEAVYYITLDALREGKEGDE